MRLLLSVPTLERGGAERQFAALARGLAGRGHAVLAVALGRGGPLAEDLGGARLVALDKRSRLDDVRTTLRLAALLREFRPDAHYAFLTAPAVLGGLLTFLRPEVPLVMGLRAVRNLPPGSRRARAARLMLHLEARLSGRAALAIANSEACRAEALRRGFPPSRLRVVPNGIDTDALRPDRALGAALRAAWLAGEPGPLIGIVARLDPLKDHATFLRAAALLLRRLPAARFVCVGEGPDGTAARLRALAQRLGLAGKIVRVGARGDMARVYNALDALCLSSISESFPNVLGEAMSCGVPCVATNVGDAARIIGETGIAVPPGNPAALADGMERLLARIGKEGEGLRRACRTRMEECFGLDRMIAETEALLGRLVRRG